MGLKDKLTKYIPSISFNKALAVRRGAVVDDEYDNSYVRSHGVDYKCGSMDDYLRTFEACSWVYVCVKRNYNSVAQVPLKVYKRQGTTRKDWIDLNVEEPNHKLVKLLQRPNPFTTETELKQGLVSCLELTGNCYFELVGDVPEQMYLLLPNKVKIVPDRKDYIKGYMYEVGNSHIGFSYDEIMHFKYFSARDQYYGLSPIRAAELGIVTFINASHYNKNFFRNSAIPDGFLYTEQELSDAAFRRLKKQWEKSHKGVDNAHRIAIGEMGLKWQAMSLSAKDMEFINSMKMSRDEILSIYGVYPVIAGVLDSAGYANVNEQKHLYWEQTITPLQLFIQDRLNLFLVPKFNDPDLFIEFDMTAVQAIRENRESEARIASAYVDRGVKTINEIRQELFGLKPVSWGDTWHPTNAGGLSVDVAEKGQQNSSGGGDVLGGSKGTALGAGPTGTNYSQANQPTKFPSENKIGKINISIEPLELKSLSIYDEELEGVSSSVSPFQEARLKLKKTQLLKSG